jgi:pimeloyl-ACP methyl ester carboxylesterase
MSTRVRLATREGTASVRRFAAEHATATLLALHGATHSADVFDRLFASPVLARFDRVALDLPGRFDSAERSRTAIDDAAFTATVLDVVAEGRRRVAIGHSYGGAVGIELALRGAIDALVLVSTGARLRVRRDMILVFETYARGEIPRPRGLGYSEGFDPEVVSALEQRLDAVPKETSLADWLAADRFDRLTELSRVSVPTLVVSGHADALTPIKYGEFLADRIQRAKLVRIEGGSHMAIIERPVEIAAAIARFVDDLPSASRA